MKAGSVLLIHSTVHPTTVISIAERAANGGVTVLDAPVTRTETVKDGPFVFCMTGGDEAAARRVKPVIDAYATDTLHVGPLGSAMALKISNNLVSWVEILVGLEAVRIAEAAGVPTESLLKVMKRNGCLSPPMNGFIQARSRAGDAEFCDFMRSQAGIGQKDLGLAEKLGRDLGAPTSIAASAGALVYGAITEIFRKQP
jgi:3-hydroxyisobutyrate dehydrogenase